jgi:dipeptidyl aminopeptidase/acylaminoacyl peptidase
VWTLRGQDSVLARTTPHHFYGTFGWSPDGRAIAYTAPGGAWVARLDGGAPSLVLGVDETPIHPDFPQGPPRQVASTASWSSRGELAVTVKTTTFKDGTRFKDGSFTWTSDEQTSVHVVDPATGADRTLDELVVADSGLLWSPDGSRFVTNAVDGATRVHGGDGAPAITLVPRLVDGSEARVSDVAWSPDGERLLGLTFTDSGAALLAVPIDGSPAAVLTPWTWAFDLITLDDVSWQPVTG